jgi:tetratricopeptide (TPR) repeat protein
MMRRTTLRLTFALAAAAFSRAAAQEAQHHHGAESLVAADSPAGAETPLYANLGSYHLAVTTASPVAQQYFDQGLRLTYGFNHDEAIKSFREAVRIDSTCAMCWWGIANALGPNINLPMDTSAVKPAWEAIQHALRRAPGATPRERAYIEAQAKRYAATPAADRSGLDSAYARAMGALVTRYPEDDDAATLFAESLMDLRPWHYWTNAGRPMAPSTFEQVQVLERVVMRNPDHPGACHFYIHAVEASNEADKALPCAKRLQTLVPAAGHLVHMPTHIYMRLGMWDLAVEHNRHAVLADERFIEERHPTGVYPMGYYPHNYDVMAAALAMLGRGSEAIAAARKIASLTPYEAAIQLPPLESYAIVPFYALARFGKWDEILAAKAPPAGLQYAPGVWHYARGLALSVKGDYAGAAAERDSVAAVGTALAPDFPAGLNSAKTVLAIAEKHLAADIATRQGKRAEAIADLRKGITLEDELTYNEPADWYLPLRQPLGALLLEAGQPKEAEREFRTDLTRHPHNGWSLRGLERSLRAQKRTREADSVAAELKQVWAKADVTIASN